MLNKYLENYKERGELNITDSGYIIRHYKQNEDYYHWHIDTGPLSQCQIHLTFLYYLNDIEEGGETEFKYQKKTFKPKAGNVLIFPANWMYVHRGVQPRSDDKYVLSTFMQITKL